MLIIPASLSNRKHHLGRGSVWAMSVDENKPAKKDGALGQLVQAESMIQFAISLPAACLIGWLIGAGLDKHLHANWMGVTGLLLGAVAGFVQIFRMASGYLKRGDD